METVARSALALLLSSEKALAFCTFVVMLGALIADIVGREVFGQGVFGFVRVAVYALILCALVGFGIATATGGHLRPKFLDGVLAGPVETAGVRAGQVVSALILLMLAKASWDVANFSREIGERDVTLGWLVWPMQVSMPIAFTLSALRHAAYAVWPDLSPIESESIE
ncbi:TRAP transporter small permease [Ruegeria marina]|uniref:TRAP transporter small permease protein n=1 Tax=Ruegeria marina TaxID=639004 RepID=A0A1G6VIB6_9RHOB|nr:TRAP transporter small permease [Ruegeria marina]SDD52655.1 TRAP-type C4-dicarboxylate transport system, small permease component [Ruegeria marina]